MRLWSLHPKMLDTKGLVALWREALLAKHVLLGETKGYKNHPQLNRFKEKPIDAIEHYLSEVFHEAERRGYKFAKEKINWDFIPQTIQVTEGQIRYELKHLMNKLRERDPERHNKTKDTHHHPIFSIIPGDIEPWEIIERK